VFWAVFVVFFFGGGVFVFGWGGLVCFLGFFFVRAFPEVRNFYRALVFEQTTPSDVFPPTLLSHA